MKDYKDKLATVFGYSSFNDEERQRRSILIILVGLTSFAGLIYSVIYVLLGVSQAMVAIQLYIGFSILNLTLYYFYKNYNLFRNVQLVAILLFPTLTHVLIGGFEQSSVVVLSAMLSPLGALMFHTAKRAKVFFIFFVLMVFVSVILDLFIPISMVDIPKDIRTVFYFLNIVTITSISFFLLLKFVSDNEVFKMQLKSKNIELSEEKQLVEETLHELKITQSQLIQHEKLASLGQLTAGIAHEIQNPLNFVNNFSEVNAELIDEMQLEMEKGNLDEAKAISIAIKENQQKINNHGKRADAIVKGMLLHSRGSSGIKEPTDINALADEYLRIAYHGLRAKDREFNASLNTDFDESIGNINIIPQDIGTVILNLINNAFYAVNEKKKLQTLQGFKNYEPTVSVSTHRSLSPGEGRGEVKISVKDNGNGIPQKILDKIFQPFFTTKPTGQGTGLGLSLAYDIVKAHGGELKVETKEGEGTGFIVQLLI